MATQYDPNFNQVQQQRVNPSLQAETIDLGINQVAREFQRQEAGLRDNMRAMADNQRALERSTATLNNRAKQDFKNLEKLGDFSQTLSKNLVEGQKKENERIKLENINQAFMDGGNPHAQAQHAEGVEYLNQLDNVERGIAANFVANGGAVDIANEIKKRSGWAAYGYAVGVARQGAAGYDSFREERKDMVVGVKADGSDLTLGNATNRAEWKAANKALRDMYMQPYLGLNQEMLNKEMIEPMRDTEALAFSTWQEELAEKEEAEEKLARTGSLFESMQRYGQTGNVLPVISDIENMIEKVTIDNFGNAAVGRKQVAEMLFALADKGIITPGQATAILNTKYKDRNGQFRKLGNFVEFQGLNQRANDAAQKAWNYETAEKRRQGRKLIDKYETIIANNGLLTPEEAEAVEAQLSGVVPRSEYIHLLETKDDKLEEQALDEFNEGITTGRYIHDGAIRYLPVREQQLAKQHNAKLKGGFQEMDDEQERNLKSWFRTYGQQLGSGSVQNPNVAGVDAERDLQREWQKWWAQNRVKYDSVDDAIIAGKEYLKDLAENHGEEDIDPLTGHKKTGWKASPMNSHSETAKAARAKQGELFQENLRQATEWVKANPLTTGNADAFYQELIPGTEKYLKVVNDTYLKTGQLTIPPIYRNIAYGMNGKVAAVDIVKAQLKAVYGTEVPESEFELEQPDQTQIRPEVQRLLTIKPTANTLFRYSIDTNAGGSMDAASQQGALSDPEDPNSPRIGQWVGGDNMNVSYTGMGGPDFMLDVTQVPLGLGYVVENAAQKYGIPPHILAGLIEQESGWDPQAYNSGSGATGIAQIVPKWHPEANPGVNAADDIMYAAKYLRELMDNYGFDLETAIYAYNAGPNTILQYGKGASRENRNYYPGVMEKSERYRRRSYGPVRPKYEQLVQDSPYNSPDLLSPVLRGRIYTLA